MTPTENLDSLKVDIKTQPVEKDSETVVIYMPLFQIVSPNANLNFVTILQSTIKGQYLSTGPQNFGMTENLVVGEALRVFGQKAQETGTEINANYELVNNDLVSHFFSSQGSSVPEQVPQKGGVQTPQHQNPIFNLSHL